MWVTWKEADHSPKNQKFEHEPHGPWKTRKGLPWAICGGCSLVRLRNPLTEWAVKHGCNHTLHPGWARARVDLVAQHQDAA